MKLFVLILAFTLTHGFESEKVSNNEETETVTSNDPIHLENYESQTGNEQSSYGNLGKVFKQNELNITNSIASIRIFPNGFICSGFFIKADIVLTTAKCVLGKNPRELHVTTGSYNSPNPMHSYEVKSVEVHERYKPLLNKNNIAMLQLKRNAKDVKVYRMATHLMKEDAPGLEGKMYRWTFFPKRKIESYVFFTAKVISSAECSLMKSQLIDWDRICTVLDYLKNEPHKSNRPGQYDVGTPLLVKYKSNVYDYFIGIYTGDFLNDLTPVQVFEESFHLYPWINHKMEKLGAKVNIKSEGEMES